MLTRAAKRKIALIVVLSLMLALLGLAYWNYATTRRLGLGIDLNTQAALDPPEYLYSFSGHEGDPLAKPIGVLVVGERVFVADSLRSVIDVFTLQGARVAQFGKGRLITPLYIAVNPKNGRLYVSDRRTQNIEVFTTAGRYLGRFDPKLPAAERYAGAPKGVQWVPVAIAFAPDGTMYVTELLKGHRLVIFAPDGTFRRSVGDAGIALKAGEGPKLFQFPNSIKVIGNEVWIADSNNRRIQVFSLDGEYLRLVETQGLPRGITQLSRTPRSSEKTRARLAVVDTLAHNVTIWDVKGTRLARFGENGVLEGQFSYPDDVSADGIGRIFVSDTFNGRIQVWGWPSASNPIPAPRTPAQWAWCLSPLLLLPILLALRKRTFMATPDFVTAIVEADALDLLPARRRRWAVWEGSYEELEAVTAPDGSRVVDLLAFESYPHSDADAQALVRKYEIAYDDASILAAARRAKVFCTENIELRKMARVLEIDVCDHAEFIARFGKGRPERND